MHLSNMNLLHGVYTVITFGQAEINPTLGGGGGGAAQAAVKSSLPPPGQVLKKSLCQPLRHIKTRACLGKK